MNENYGNINELENRLKQIEETADRQDVENRLAEELKYYKGDDEIIHFKDVQEQERKINYSSGLHKLDNLIEGFHESDLIVVTGPTGQGKTTLLQTFTIALSKQKIKSLWFTYEVSIWNLIRNFGSSIPDGYTPKTLRENSIIWIERRIVEAIVKFGVKAVFIDPFNSLTKFSSPRLSQELGDLSERLKQIALKYNIILFVSAHSRRLSQDEIVSEDSIRDTALLGNKADSIIALWRNRKKQTKADLLENGIIYKNESTLSVAKNRLNGKTGFVKVIHDGNKFLVMDDSIQS